MRVKVLITAPEYELSDIWWSVVENEGTKTGETIALTRFEALANWIAGQGPGRLVKRIQVLCSEDSE